MQSNEPDGVAHPRDNFERIVVTPKPRWDDDEPDREATTYPGEQPGPDPVPAWVITENAARQREIGVIKAGKEAEVFAVERWLGGRVNLLAAKRYRDVTQRRFRNDIRYRESRTTGDRRIDRAMTRKTRRGMAFRAREWAAAEFAALCRLWAAGAPVPYPVQLLGTEVMLEFIGGDGVAAPRLADVPSASVDVTDVAGQAVEALRVLTACGVVHGDLSAYNTLLWGGRLFLIDFPQAAETMTVAGIDLLRRDVDNLLGWFARRGADVDPEAVYADLVADVFREWNPRQ